jgi:hypothetical protein
MNATIYTALTKRALVRAEYSECRVWRQALGNDACLHPFVTDGNLDAPERIPSGAHGGLESVER